MAKSFLYRYKRWVVLFFILPSLTAVIISKQYCSEVQILPAENYPRWLMNDSYKTSQTSGITFLRQQSDGTQEFLLADDIGDIHRLFVEDDSVFNFRKIYFGLKVIGYLKDFPKPDFEEILYDKFTNRVYITIEGNGENHIFYHGIFELKFKNDDVFQDSVVNLEKLAFMPAETFNNNLKPNTGYEGLAVDENYFYLGLEAVLALDKSFSGHTLIRIADKKSHEIVKEISADTLGISTI